MFIQHAQFLEIYCTMLTVLNGILKYLLRERILG